MMFWKKVKEEKSFGSKTSKRQKVDYGVKLEMFRQEEPDIQLQVFEFQSKMKSISDG